MEAARIGCGVMGTSILPSLRRGGHTVSIYNHTYERVVLLLEQEIRVECTIRDCVGDADVVCTMVSYPKDMEEIYRGDGGTFAHTRTHTALIGFTIPSPALTEKLYIAVKAKGYAMLSALVSGSDGGAEAISLSIMTGGDEEVSEQMRPLFSLLGTGAQYMGEAENGQHTKACSQIAVAGTVAAMSEALVYVRAVGLGEQGMFTAIAKGAIGSWQIDNTAPRALANDFAPGFYIKHFIKDVHIAQQEMEQQDIHLDMLETVYNMYEVLAGMGEENNDTQALVYYYKWI